MITNDLVTNGAVKFSLYGLSTDTKPTNTYDGYAIANGSSYMEMDTKKLYYYDAANNVWV